MKKAVLFLILIIVAGGFFFWPEISDFYSKLVLRSPRVEEKINLIEEVEKQIITPTPLRSEEEAPEPSLTRTEIIEWTNFQREKYGLPPLQENPALNASAALKVEDMLAKQYFNHISPSGEGLPDLAEKVGYEFIVIGENLALGNFSDDQALVQGWMGSLGHRQNILNLKYQEIGVAVLRGFFEGKTVWLAVQHFGFPLSTCSQPSEVLLAEIETNQARLKKMEITLRELQLEIRRVRLKWGPNYNKKVEQYNNLVSQYNALLSQTQDLVNQYNNQVALFNQCVLE